jgi:flagellar biosynthesis/type III secretory pathway M-ring protein FliF/YscJ
MSYWWVFVIIAAVLIILVVVIIVIIVARRKNKKEELKPTQVQTPQPVQPMQPMQQAAPQQMGYAQPMNAPTMQYQMLPSRAKEWMSANRGAPGFSAGRRVYAMAQLSEVVKVFF